MSKTSSNRAGQPECAVDLEEGAWYYDRDRRELFTVRENRIRFDPENTRFVGTLTTEASDGGVSTYQAGDVESWSFVHDIFPVPERVIEDPEGIVREYAVEQIHEDIGVLGKSHEYTGIEGVETVRDLSLALDQLDVR
ncbi:MAG: hypothetical protein ACI8XM_000027 [Haloarculaceae archaeon]|jgi:hypothetical protein